MPGCDPVNGRSKHKAHPCGAPLAASRRDPDVTEKSGRVRFCWYLRIILRALRRQRAARSAGVAQTEGRKARRVYSGAQTAAGASSGPDGCSAGKRRRRSHASRLAGGQCAANKRHGSRAAQKCMVRPGSEGWCRGHMGDAKARLHARAPALFTRERGSWRFRVRRGKHLPPGVSVSSDQRGRHPSPRRRSLRRARQQRPLGRRRGLQRIRQTVDRSNRA